MRSVWNFLCVILAAAAVCSAASAAAPVKRVEAPALDPVTKVDGETLQVVFGQRAVFRLDEAGRPTIDAVEKGQLADAHLKGMVKEAFAPPKAGQLAAALDASSQKRASVLKIWNGLPHAVEYRLATLTLRQGKLEATPVKSCALAAGQVYSQSWPKPVLAVALTHFVEASAEAAPCQPAPAR